MIRKKIDTAFNRAKSLAIYTLFPYSDPGRTFRKTVCVTFPRSGHHMLVRLLTRYYAGELGPLQDSPKIQKLAAKHHYRAGKLCYCEYYDHCRTVPCSDTNTNFQKTHALDLKLI